MNSITLVKPNLLYKTEFLKFVDDVKSTGYETYDIYVEALSDFERFVENLDNTSKGINLPKGWVPCSSFWLVNNAGEVLGVIRIRHRVDNPFLQTIGHIGYEIKSNQRNKGYGSKILELGLLEASNIGLDKVLVTSYSDNGASVKIIKKFGGVYKQSFFDEDTNKEIMQFEIPIKG